jgi:hypothetical protein
MRDLWTLHWSQSNCTAAIWRNEFGLELRVLHGDELIESRLSRFGDAPLLLIAEEVKANLIEQGWRVGALMPARRSPGRVHVIDKVRARFDFCQAA